MGHPTFRISFPYGYECGSYRFHRFRLDPYNQIGPFEGVAMPEAEVVAGRDRSAFERERGPGVAPTFDNKRGIHYRRLFRSCDVHLKRGAAAGMSGCQDKGALVTAISFAAESCASDPDFGRLKP